MAVYRAGRLRLRGGSLLVAGCCLLDVRSAGAEPPARDLTSLSLEELLQVEVVSLAKHAQPILDTPASVTVLTREDLRRSGARSLPEALRLVPGLEVARVDSSKWAISARGFNSRRANKLQVLIDGRTIYSSLFSGVFWELQNIPLAEIERVEVIRGPGGALWGANAVDGVIDIITRPAAAEAETEITVGGGNAERAFVDAGVSGSLGSLGSLGAGGRYRLWATRRQTDSLDSPAAAGFDAPWQAAGAGFRADWERASDSFSLQGGYLRSRIANRLDLPTLIAPYTAERTAAADLSEGHLLARLRRGLAGGAVATVQAFFTRERRDDILLGNAADTFDLDTQVELPVRGRHRVVGGLGVRAVADRFRSTAIIGVVPARRTTALWSGFLQDEVALFGGRATLTAGAKLEHNARTGFEVQPSLRLLARLDGRQSLWFAVSRGVRTPARIEGDLDRAWLATLPPPAAGAPPVELVVAGNRDLAAQELVAWEAGYRLRAPGGWSADLALFANRIRHFYVTTSGAVTAAPEPPAALTQNLVVSDGGHLSTRGLEVDIAYAPSAAWRIDGSYSLQSFGRLFGPPGQVSLAVVDGYASPRQQAQLGGRVDLPGGIEADLQLRYSGRLDVYGIEPHVAVYTRLGWRFYPGLELALAGRDLLAGRHLEFGATEIGERPSRIAPSYHLSLTWRR